MKAAAIVRFYLPYWLPRAPDWEHSGVKFELPDVVAKVSARPLNETLFPFEIDQTLGSMTLGLTRLSLPVSSVAMAVRDFCFDRLNVQVEGEIAAPCEQEEKRFVDAAVRAANAFLGHCRVAARAPFITGVEQHYRIEDGRTYILTPRTVTWFDALTGENLPFYSVQVNASAASGTFHSPVRGAVEFAAIVASLNTDAEPDLVRSLLVDAEERTVTLRTREAVLSMATAVAANRYLDKSGMADDRQVRQLVSEKTSFAEKRLHSVPWLVSSR